MAPDRDKVKALTNAVMADDGITGQLADTMSPLTDVVAETKYQFHAGHAKPVTEEQVVQAVNGIADQLKAPTYPTLIDLQCVLCEFGWRLRLLTLLGDVSLRSHIPSGKKTLEC